MINIFSVMLKLRGTPVWPLTDFGKEKPNRPLLQFSLPPSLREKIPWLEYLVQADAACCYPVMQHSVKLVFRTGSMEWKQERETQTHTPQWSFSFTLLAGTRITHCFDLLLVVPSCCTFFASVNVYFGVTVGFCT